MVVRDKEAEEELAAAVIEKQKKLEEAALELHGIRKFLHYWQKRHDESRDLLRDVLGCAGRYDVGPAEVEIYERASSTAPVSELSKITDVADLIPDAGIQREKFLEKFQGLAVEKRKSLLEKHAVRDADELWEKYAGTYRVVGGITPKELPTGHERYVILRNRYQELLWAETAAHVAEAVIRQYEKFTSRFPPSVKSAVDRYVAKTMMKYLAKKAPSENSE